MTDVGVLLPTFDPLRTGARPVVAEAARLAEELGFDDVSARLSSPARPAAASTIDPGAPR